MILQKQRQQGIKHVIILLLLIIPIMEKKERNLEILKKYRAGKTPRELQQEYKMGRNNIYRIINDTAAKYGEDLDNE